MTTSGANKGKNVVESSRASSDNSGSDNDVPRPVTKRAKKTSKTGGQQVPKKKPSISLRVRKMNQMEFVQTKWVDHQILKDLGIFDHVRSIFIHMGLGGLFHMSHVACKGETIQFLATLSVEDDTALDIGDENRGRLRFNINGEDYCITMAQLGSLFNFPPGGQVYSLSLDMNEAQGVWSTIAKDEYKKGVSKASNIRHPAIRYVHKFLANTLFARRETGAVKEEELALLIEGIKPFLQTTADGEEIIGQPKRINFAHYLAHRFLFYQDWVTTNKDKTPQLGIGGLITPILEACGVTMSRSDEPLAFLDTSYLYTARFLAGRTKKSYGYRFVDTSGAKKIIILPNVQATTLQDRQNILFTPPQFLLYNPSRDGPLRSSRAAPQSNDDDEEPPEEVYGSRRYAFEPYSGPISGEALGAAHEHIGLLQRLCKWQGKQIKKLVKNATKQAKQIKQLLRERSPRGTEEGGGSSMALAMEATHEETRPPRQRRGKAPLSPPSSGSGNRSYSIDSSSSRSN